MDLQGFCKEAMDIAKMADDGEKARAVEDFFQRMNSFAFPEGFNWAQEVFEGLHVAEQGDKTALIWADMDSGEERRFTYSQMAACGNRLLNHLRRFGVEKGHNMYMMTPIVPETWFAHLACIKGGLIAVPTATTMTVRELQFRFQTYPPDTVIADTASVPAIDEALEKTGASPKVKLILGEKQGWTSYADLERESDSAEAARTRCEDLLFCFFTSGTTGLPKRVGHTATSYPLGHLSTALLIGIRPEDIHHNLSAPGWAKWAWSSFFAPFNMGATVAAFYFRALEGNKYLDYVSRYKVSTFCAPPTGWRMFVRLDLERFDFSSLRHSVSAGEPLNPEAIQKWKEHTGDVIRDFYGQTESTAMIGNAPWMKETMRTGSFGVPSPMYDVTLADDEAKEIREANETGHIVVRLDRWRAIGLFTEYIGNPQKMKEVFVSDFYYTGDRAYVDQDGYWWFVGRADDVIKSSDFRVGPFEVESAMVEHPAVAESAVVGVPDPERYQLVKAYVILSQGNQPSSELALELFRHSLQILPKFKIPRILEFVEEVPKTISGKIRRIELREKEEEKKQQETAERNREEYFYWDFPELSSRK
ncbi:MAG: AMP-binding protein [Desulfohalobiaceae bacterium]|nr:AMP-binding protein [Desulfohalobiaceae bacterium]